MTFFLSADAHAAAFIDVHVVVLVVVVPAEIRFETTYREWEKIVVGIVERAAVIIVRSLLRIEIIDPPARVWWKQSYA